MIIARRRYFADPSGSSEQGPVRDELLSRSTGIGATLPAEALRALRRNPNIELIEADRRVTFAATSPRPRGGWTASTSATCR